MTIRRIGMIISMLCIVVIVSGCAIVSAPDSSTDNTNAIVNGSGTNGSVFDAEAATSVTIRDHAFFPQVITVSVNDTVTWTNQDEALHSIQAGLFGSGNLQKGDTFSYQFAARGSFHYSCGLHPDMTGEVIVK